MREADVDRSSGPFKDPTRSPAAAVTDNLADRDAVNASSASRITADRLLRERRARAVILSSSCWGTLREMARMGFDLWYYPTTLMVIRRAVERSRAYGAGRLPALRVGAGTEASPYGFGAAPTRSGAPTVEGTPGNPLSP